MIAQVCRLSDSHAYAQKKSVQMVAQVRKQAKNKTPNLRPSRAPHQKNGGTQAVARHCDWKKQQAANKQKKGGARCAPDHRKGPDTHGLLSVTTGQSSLTQQNRCGGGGGCVSVKGDVWCDDNNRGEEASKHRQVH